MKTDHDDARCCRRWVTQDVGKVAVKGYDSPTFRRRDGEQAFIIRACQSLIARQGDIVPGHSKDARDTVGDVLVELYGRHDQAVTGTMLSRANSAAYANAAGMASLGSVG